MARVLVTGASGFTGVYMAAELIAHDHEPIGFVATESEVLPAAYIERHVADLLDASALREAVLRAAPDFVIHLAGLAFVGHGNAEDIYRTNLVGTRNLLEALVALPKVPSMTLLASSANVYGNAQTEFLDESVPPAPANDYAVSKLAMEYMARLYMGRLPLVIARPFNYTGVGQSTQFLIPKIMDHARRHIASIELGNLDVWRDFSDVRVVSRAYRLLLECPAAANLTVNVCSGEVFSIREVLDMTAELTGHPMDVTVNQAFVRTNELRELRGNRSLLESLVGPVAPKPFRETLAWMLA
ncbi:MAG: GDP-mannose 4,6-dehydratase [Ramlibacter sp.]|nr:GDP-mannose 4,6-dehydratase [Ramlibacter sp.]